MVRAHKKRTDRANGPTGKNAHTMDVGCVMKKNNLVEHKKGVPDSLNVRIFLCYALADAPNLHMHNYDAMRCEMRITGPAQ